MTATQEITTLSLIFVVTSVFWTFGVISDQLFTLAGLVYIGIAAVRSEAWLKRKP